MRKMMTKEVPFTYYQVAKMEVENGKPVTVEVGEFQELGNISDKKLDKLVKKNHGHSATPYNIDRYTVTYEMQVQEFIKLANVKEGVNKWNS